MLDRSQRPMTGEDRRLLQERFAADRPRPVRTLVATFALYGLAPYLLLRLAGLLTMIGLPGGVARWLGFALAAFYLGAMHTLRSDARKKRQLARARQRVDLDAGIVDVLEFSPIRAWAIDIGPGTGDQRRFGGYLAQVSPTRFVALAMDEAIDGEVPARFPRRVRWACAPATRETLEFRVSEDQVDLEADWVNQIEFYPVLRDDFGYGADCVRELQAHELPPALRERLIK